MLFQGQLRRTTSKIKKLAMSYTSTFCNTVNGLKKCLVLLMGCLLMGCCWISIHQSSFFDSPISSNESSYFFYCFPSWVSHFPTFLNKHAAGHPIKITPIPAVSNTPKIHQLKIHVVFTPKCLMFSGVQYKLVFTNVMYIS